MFDGAILPKCFLSNRTSILNLCPSQRSELMVGSVQIKCISSPFVPHDGTCGGNQDVNIHKQRRSPASFPSKNNNMDPIFDDYP